jgi:hypothetical protein
MHLDCEGISVKKSQEWADFTTGFDPKAYLRSYYAWPDEEDKFIIQFMIAMLQQMPTDLVTLEFGGGPTLYAVAALAPRSREIHFCDYVPENLREVQDWFDNHPDAYDWEPYIEMVLEEEGISVTSETVAQRAMDMRQKVTRLSRCDALAQAPLGRGAGQYDLVVAQAVTDSVATDFSEWVQVMSNISSLVKPGGGLLISVITGTEYYSVGPHRYANLHLTAEDIRKGYEVAGYDPATFCLERMVAPTERDYAGLTTVMARKSGDSR